jgi:hypothetical protein
MASFSPVEKEMGQLVMEAFPDDEKLADVIKRR